MSDTKFTPGPWKVEQGGYVHKGWTVITARHEEMTNESPLALLSNVLGADSVAPDAALIAAAPDLYAAAELAFEYLKGERCESHFDVMEALSAAINNARGES